MSAFRDLASIPPQQLGDGYLARAIHGARATFAVVEIDPGAELPEHRHDHEQLGIVLRGSVRFRVGGEERVLEPGAVYVIPSQTPHMVSGGPDGAAVLDVFAPVREEWKELQPQEPRAPRWP